MTSTRSAFLLAAAVAIAPHAARADDSDATPSPDAEPGADDASDYPNISGPPSCIDRSDVVGYRRCTPYGEWGSNLSDPYLFVDLGMNVRHFAFGGGIGAAARTTSPSQVSPGHSDDALMLDERIGFGLTQGLYLALDFELGNFGAFNSAKPSARDVVLDSLAVFGFRAGLAPGSLAVEIAGGGRAYSYPTDNDLRSEAVVEAHGRAGLWLSPWVTVGAVAGTSLIRSGDWMTGLYLGFHSYSYAGDR